MIVSRGLFLVLLFCAGTERKKILKKKVPVMLTKQDQSTFF
jgi:hypothetical protein